MVAIRLHHPRLGTRKLHHLLQLQPEVTSHVGRDKLFQILRIARLQIVAGRALHKTTDSTHCFYLHPSLLKTVENQVLQENDSWRHPEVL